LVVPKAHVVSSVRALTTEQLPLVQFMHSLALSLHPTAKIGYHVPPFSSVPHLHLHVLVGRPSFLGRLMYPTARYGWFKTGAQVEDALERGHSVGLA